MGQDFGVGANGLETLMTNSTKFMINYFRYFDENVFNSITSFISNKSKMNNFIY